eukprot:402834-Pelagomonas_calceolata.AAC.1
MATAQLLPHLLHQGDAAPVLSDGSKSSSSSVGGSGRGGGCSTRITAHTLGAPIGLCAGQSTFRGGRRWCHACRRGAQSPLCVQGVLVGGEVRK